jgi:hypothetical protein
MTPSQRTIKHLKDQGYMVANVELNEKVKQ